MAASFLVSNFALVARSFYDPGRCRETFYLAAGEPAGAFDVPEEDPQAAASDQHQRWQW